MDSSSAKEEEVGDYNATTIKKAKLNSTLGALLEDPILSDVPKKPTLSDVDTLISLELGSAMRVTVLKLDGSSFDVAVMNSAIARELKLAIKKRSPRRNNLRWVTAIFYDKFTDSPLTTLKENVGFTKSLLICVLQEACMEELLLKCLTYNNEKLLDEKYALQDIGIRNNSQVQFVPHITSKSFGKHSKRTKHSFFHGLNKHL